MTNRVDPELKAYRASIDNIDAAFIHLLAERFKITKKVGEYKAAHNYPPADKERERYQIDRLRKLARSTGLDPNFTEQFLLFISREVIRHHEQVNKYLSRPIPIEAGSLLTRR